MKYALHMKYLRYEVCFAYISRISMLFFQICFCCVDGMNQNDPNLTAGVGKALVFLDGQVTGLLEQIKPVSRFVCFF